MQNQEGDPNEISYHEDSIINICSNKNSEGHSVIVVEEKLGRNLSNGQIPVPSTLAQQPITQEEPDTVPFHSDEQPIKVENNSIISATHEETIQIFEAHQKNIDEAKDIADLQEASQATEVIENAQKP